MDKLVTIIRFNSPTELAIVKGRLESEGIACFVEDEFMVQHYAQAVGGTKLQVQQRDALRAVNILINAGYLSDEYQPSELWENLDRWTKGLPWIGRIGPLYRLMMLVVVAGGILMLWIWGLSLL